MIKKWQKMTTQIQNDKPKCKKKCNQNAKKWQHNYFGISNVCRPKIFLMLEHMPLSKYPRFVLWRAPLQFPTLKPAAFIAIPWLTWNQISYCKYCTAQSPPSLLRSELQDNSLMPRHWSWPRIFSTAPVNRSRKSVPVWLYPAMPTRPAMLMRPMIFRMQCSFGCFLLFLSTEVCPARSISNNSMSSAAFSSSPICAALALNGSRTKANSSPAPSSCSTVRCCLSSFGTRSPWGMWQKPPQMEHSSKGLQLKYVSHLYATAVFLPLYCCYLPSPTLGLDSFQHHKHASAKVQSAPLVQVPQERW